jgi:hypothetical protein
MGDVLVRIGRGDAQGLKRFCKTKYFQLGMNLGMEKINGVCLRFSIRDAFQSKRGFLSSHAAKRLLRNPSHGLILPQHDDCDLSIGYVVARLPRRKRCCSHRMRRLFRSRAPVRFGRSIRARCRTANGR